MHPPPAAPGSGLLPKRQILWALVALGAFSVTSSKDKTPSKPLSPFLMQSTVQRSCRPGTLLPINKFHMPSTEAQLSFPSFQPGFNDAFYCLPPFHFKPKTRVFLYAGLLGHGCVLNIISFFFQLTLHSCSCWSGGSSKLLWDAGLTFLLCNLISQTTTSPQLLVPKLPCLSPQTHPGCSHNSAAPILQPCCCSCNKIPISGYFSQISACIQVRFNQTGM